jgi:lipopolysaccharide transport system ATP-binding protein
MSDTVIKVENLGKKYLIRHQQRERYTALRDVLANKFKSFGKRLVSLQPHSSNLQPSREEFWALKDISFEVKQGDRIGIIGRNGAGKTTLLKLLSRITEPTTGRIAIKGRVASLLEVGTGFHPELTGRENIYLNGAILGMTKSEIKKKFDEIVDFAEIEKFLDTPVKHYSSGMYVRLAFAVAAHLEPEILLVDEVLAVGDAQFQKKCLGKMEEVGKGGRTIFFVSHNMTAIQSLCTNAILLVNGRLNGFGNVEEQIDRYLNSGESRDQIGPDSSYQLGSNLILRKLEFSPNPIASGSNLNFNLALESISVEIIESIVILIYSSLGIHVAILDLRTKDFPLRINEANQLTISGRIRSLPLVEGDYSIGIYIQGNKTWADFFDVMNLTVKPQPYDGDAVKYSPNVRGFIDLEYTLF